jgi:hypothetical protein
LKIITAVPVSLIHSHKGDEKMTTKIELARETQSSPSALRKLLWVSPLAIALTTAANLAFYTVAGAIFPQVTAWSGAGIGQIIGANIAYLFVGTIVFALIACFSSRPARHYWIVSTIGLLLSLALPISAGFGYGAPGALPADVATVVTLSLMHVVSYAISVPLFIREVLN